MTDSRKKSRKLSYEILGLFAVCFAISLLLFFFLSFFGVAAVEGYCWNNDITLDEDQLFHLDSIVFSVALAMSVIFFILLFLLLFGERLSYIRTIIKGVDRLQRGEHGYVLPLEGNNELTQLAQAINYLSLTEQEIKNKERTLNEEKEELVRTLSHDIRTPLTSILSYTELLGGKDELSADEQKEYISLVRKKSGQIKDLTDILLDGGRREVEFFADARLLFEQLVGEFDEVLEDSFPLSVDVSVCPNFSGRFDVREMRRIFDNLISNIQKYADPSLPVELSVVKNTDGITIRQSNAVKKNAERTDSYKMGLYSIKRIAQSYKGGAEVRLDEEYFEIIITLSDF